MTVSLPPLLRLVGWLAFAGLAATLFAGLCRQPVDPTNSALKDPASADAAALRDLAEVVPPDPVLLLGLATRGGLPISADDRQRCEPLRAHLAALPGVLGAAAAPVVDPGLALFVVTLAPGDVLAHAQGVVRLADEQAPPTLRVLATGLPLIEGTIAALVAGERTSIVPALVAVLLLAAFAFYRSTALAIAVLLPALAGIAATSGALAWLGHRLDPIAALLDPVLLTIGVAASVHFVEGFRAAIGRRQTAAAAAATAARELRTPALLATGTTMVGLWSLGTSSIPAVSDFGWRSALGVAVVHLFVFLLLPPWLAAFARPAASGSESTAARGRWLPWVQRHRLRLATATAALTALAVAGLPALRADNDPLRLLPTRERARADHDALAARLGGVETCHLLVAARSPASEPSRLLPLLASLRQEPGLAGLAGPVLRGLEGALAVPLLLQPGGSATRTRTFAALEDVPRVLGLDGVRVAGASVQIARDSERLLRSLGTSFAVSLVLLGGAMVVGLRSWRLGLLALVPNVLPAAWVYGTLGWLDRPLSVATGMIGCTMLGLIVDNTLHLLHQYRVARRAVGAGDALAIAWRRCGRAIALTSSVLMLGFGAAASSNLATTVEFAVLAAATIGASWVATATVLPLLVGSSGGGVGGGGRDAT